MSFELASGLSRRPTTTAGSDCNDFNPPTEAGRRKWIGLAVLALACLLYVMDLTVLHVAIIAVVAFAVAILAIVLLRNVGSGDERNGAPDAETERTRQNERARDRERTHREARRTPAPVPEA